MGDKLVRAADTQFLVSRVREVGKRSKLDMERLISAGLAVAKRNSSDILSGLNDIASDGVVSPTEKRHLDLLYKQLEAEHPTVDSEAGKYSELSSWTASDAAKLKAYDDAYEAFSRLLSEILKDMDSSSQISQAVLSEVSQSYYTALKELDEVLQGFRYGIFGIEYRYKATSTQDRPSAEEVTLTEPPAMSPTEKYLWRKQTITYTNGRTEVTVELIAIYGDSGESAKVCTIDCDRSAVMRNDRSTGSLDYTFTITVQGMAGAVTVKVNGIDETASLVQDGSKYILKKTVPLKEAYSLSAILYLDEVEKDRCELYVIDETTKSVSLGAVTQLPTTTPYGDIIDRDYFIAAVAFKSGGVDYEKAVPYVRHNGAWTKLTTSDEGYSEKMLQCCGDLLAANVDIPASATAVYGWFANLAAQSAVFGTLAANDAFIKLLKVYNLFVGTGSRSSGFYVEISDHREGSTVEEICFNVWYNGQKVFSVDPATGNVYMGGGFLYQASTQSIRSSSGKVVIDGNGELAAENCRFKDGIFEGDFDCDVIKTTVQPQVYDAFTISDLTNRQAETFRTQVSASSKATYAYDTFYRCSIPAIPSASFIRFFDKGSQKKEDTTYNVMGIQIKMSVTLTFQGFATFYDSSYNGVDVSSLVGGNRTLHIYPSGVAGIDIDFGTIVDNASIASYKYETVLTIMGQESTKEMKEDGVMFSSSKSLTLVTGGKRLEVSLPESSANLSKGMLYSDGGVVKIVT